MGGNGMCVWSSFTWCLFACFLSHAFLGSIVLFRRLLFSYFFNYSIIFIIICFLGYSVIGLTHLTLSGPGGVQRPGWSNSQLPIRNLLSYDAQTWWLLVFILETPFGHILAKLVNQRGCCWSFLIETSQKFWKWKIFPMLENCWNWHGGSILGREKRFWT